MKLNLNIKFLNGFWSLLSNICFKLSQFIPLYILVFIAYGDLFLPKPLSNASYYTRTKINNVLLGSFMEKVVENLENEKYNNKKLDKVTNQLENKWKNGNNK